MLRVGLTGGIGAGKSTVSARLRELGATIIDADRIAREVVAPGTPGLTRLAEAFGPDIIASDGGLDRAELALRAFADDESRELLNSITHPLVGERTAEILAGAPADAVVVQDIPLLVEGGMAPLFALTIVVDTPEEIRLRRLVDSRGMDLDDARARIAAQASDEARRLVADVLLDNTGTPADLERAVDHLWEERLVPYERNLRMRTGVVGSSEPVPADPAWADEARREIARLRVHIGGVSSGIEHVGPTTTGDPAPDVIDLRVSTPDARTVCGVLEKNGYVPELGSACRVYVGSDPARPIRLVIDEEETAA